MNVHLLFPLLSHAHYADADADGYNQLVRLRMNVHYLEN